jgi:magnesium transporter
MHIETTFRNFSWIDLCNPSKAEIEQVSKDNNLDFHLVTDSLEPGHLPKIERMSNTTFMILRAYIGDVNKSATSVQELSSKIAIFIKGNILITLHRLEHPFLNKMKKNRSSEYDIYDHTLLIIDKIIDSYIPSAEVLSRDIDNIEKNIFLKNLKEISLKDLYFLKAESRISKKLLVITQQVLNQFSVPSENKTALQDVKDSLVKIILEFEEVLDDSQNLMNTYMSVTSNKTNDVMKLLTIFSAFFLPLTFIAGVYGMNFEFMPELSWKGGYPLVIIVMLIVIVIIWSWFKKKKIIG